MLQSHEVPRASAYRAAGGFPGQVRISCRSAPRLGAWVLAGHAVGAASVLNATAWPNWLRLTLVAGLVGSMILGLRALAWREGRSRIVTVILSGCGALCLVQRDGRRRCGHWQAGSYVTHSLVILRWRAPGAIWSRACVIPYQADQQEELRQLRTLLRHPL